MRLEELILRIPGDEFQVRFHEHLTVLSGVGMLERQALADSIIGALTGGADNAVARLVDHTGRPFEIVANGGSTEARYLDDESPALGLVGTVAPSADALRALMLLQAGDLGLTPTHPRADEHPELVEARATLQQLTTALDAAKSGRTKKEQLAEELEAVENQIRQASDNAARRQYASVLANLERVRAEAAALQSGQTGAETDQHLLDSAESARRLVQQWKDAAGRVARLDGHAPGHRLDDTQVADRRWYPDVIPTNLYELVDDVASARAEQERLEGRLRNLATSKLPEPSDPRIVDLATLDQTELWQAAAAVVEAGRALSREQVAVGGLTGVTDAPKPVDKQTLDLIARLEDAHQVVEDLEAVVDRRRVPTFAGASLVAVAGIVAVPILPVAAVGLLAAAIGGAVVGIGRPMRRLRAAEQNEAEALDATGAESYLGFHIRRVEASITPGAHDRLEAANNCYVSATTRWRQLAGDMTIDEAKQIENDVRAYAAALVHLGASATELDAIRRELSEQSEPAVARARDAVAAACAPYGLQPADVAGLDAPSIEHLIHDQIALGHIARAQEELGEAEADEEKVANRLDDLLHHLGFRDGTLDARAGALDWAVERAAERQEARSRARSRSEIEDDLQRLQAESRRLRRPEWATVQPSEADGPDVEELEARKATLQAELRSVKEEPVDYERLLDRRDAMERRIAALESQLDAESPESTIAQVADVQQYLVSHLTKAGHCGPDDESVPVLIDEAFLRIAPERKWELLDMLRRLGERTQLIYLTDDAFVSAWARRRASAGLITLLEPIDA